MGGLVRNPALSTSLNNQLNPAGRKRNSSNALLRATPSPAQRVAHPPLRRFPRLAARQFAPYAHRSILLQPDGHWGNSSIDRSAVDKIQLHCIKPSSKPQSSRVLSVFPTTRNDINAPLVQSGPVQHPAKRTRIFTLPHLPYPTLPYPTRPHSASEVG